LYGVYPTTKIKDKRINIRMTGHDFEAIQRKAIQEGMPYQTLISSLIHEYIRGEFKTKEIFPGAQIGN
jgi:predicted DNA binding CopG/RHH family protein